MRKIKLPLLLASCIGFATGSQSLAAESPGMAGFPIYPHASSPLSSNSTMVPGYVLQSHDSLATIDRWYRSKLPATCERVVLASKGGTAIEYRCRATPRVFLDIVPDGGNVDIHAYPV